MSLYITYQDGRVSEHCDPLKFLLSDLPNVSHIQADGTELEVIKLKYACSAGMWTADKHFTIPMTHERVVCWAGDIARTILLNL